MGYAKTPLNPPTDYLKKTSPPGPSGATFKYSTAERRPPVPSHKVEHKPNYTQKNFINKNAVDVIKAPAKKPIPKYVDTRGGHKSELIPSGLYPKFSQKEDYGKVPEYLIEKRRLEEEAQQEYNARSRKRSNLDWPQNQLGNTPSPISRPQCCDGYFTKEILHHQFQGLSVVT